MDSKVSIHQSESNESLHLSSNSHQPIRFDWDKRWLKGD